MIINGICQGTHDMYINATVTHDKVIIIAGGAGIISYISLLRAIRQQCIQDMMIPAITRPTIDLSINHDLEGDTVVVGGGAAKTQRIIDVHWLCRDEGLITHVLTNYLEPFYTISPTTTTTTDHKNDYSSAIHNH
jgi:hypothetical protein